MTYWIIGGCVVVGLVLMVGLLALIGAGIYFARKKSSASASPAVGVAADYLPMSPSEIHKAEVRAAAMRHFDAEFDAREAKARVKEAQDVMAGVTSASE